MNLSVSLSTSSQMRLRFPRYCHFEANIWSKALFKLLDPSPAVPTPLLSASLAPTSPYYRIRNNYPPSHRVEKTQVAFSGTLPSSIWAAATKYHTLGGFRTTESYFSHFWRLEIPRSRFQQIPCLVRAPFLDFSLYFTWGKRALVGCFYEGTNPI